VRRGRADVGPDRTQLQPLARDVAGMLVFIGNQTAMRVMRMAVGVLVLRG